MRKQKNRWNSGESLVEVMVSAVIFLLMVAVMQGAISFCTNGQQKSRQLRETNAEICQGLPEAEYKPGDGTGSHTAVYTFKASSANGTQTGTATLFQVEVKLGRKEVPYGTGQTSTFYLFGPPEDPGTGGGSP